MAIRILLVDDHPIVRTGLRSVLEAESDIEVVGEADTGGRAISLAHRLRPDVVLTDLLLPDMDGVAVTQHVRAESPATQVVVLTSVSEQNGAVVRTAQAGAISYLVKGADVDELLLTIRSAGESRVHLSPRAAARLMQE